MREELSLKAAILAEKFAPDLSWYVIDTPKNAYLYLFTWQTSYI